MFITLKRGKDYHENMAKFQEIKEKNEQLKKTNATEDAAETKKEE